MKYTSTALFAVSGIASWFSLVSGRNVQPEKRPEETGQFRRVVAKPSLHRDYGREKRDSSGGNLISTDDPSVVTVYITVKPDFENPDPVPTTTVTVNAQPAPLPVTSVSQAVPAPQSAAPISASGSTALVDTSSPYPDQMISITNLYRSYHNAGPLKWNQTLVDYLRPYAATCEFKHSGGPYGENIAMGTYTSGPDSVAMWYNEQGLYKDDTGFSHDTGHYTALVWKGTTDLGCVTQKCTNSYYTMCSYYPPGNYGGQYQKQVEGLMAGAPTGTQWPVGPASAYNPSPSNRVMTGEGVQATGRISTKALLTFEALVLLIASF